MCVLNRKSQVTIFIVVGIVIIFGVSAAIYMGSLKEDKKTEVETQIKEQSAVNLESLNTFVESCIQKEAAPAIKLMAYQGGTLSLSSNYRLHDKKKYRYLCIDDPDYVNCVSTLLTRQDMEKELEEYLQRRLR